MTSLWLFGGLLVGTVLGLAAGVVVLARHRTTAHRAARTDPLTGIGNRVRLEERGAQLLGAPPQRDHRSTDEPAPSGPALLLLDLDGFKEVNDALGHAAGDALLVQVAQRLVSAARPGDLVARLGGDEFAVLAAAPITADEATALGKELLAALGAGGFTAGPEVGLDVGGSMGVATAPADGTSTGELLRHADLAMYEAKRTRAGICTYRAAESATPTEGHDRLHTLSLMRGAMEDDELLLHYQPVADAASGRLLGFEALLRWDHPTRGLLMPQEFLPSAERTSLIRPLTRWVLLRATRQGAQWRQDGLDLTLAVNLSASMLEQGVLGIVEEALARSRFPAHQLVLEITESAVATSAEEAHDVVCALREMGIGVAIDDFGAGFTGLSQLRGLAFTHLKVDRQFVTGMLSDPVDESIAATIIDLGHRLGATVVAEGVEDAATAARLVQLGCDHLQGNAVGRPAPAADALRAWPAQPSSRPDEAAGSPVSEVSGGSGVGGPSHPPEQHQGPVVGLVGAHRVDDPLSCAAVPPPGSGR